MLFDGVHKLAECSRSRGDTLRLLSQGIYRVVGLENISILVTMCDLEQIETT